MNDTQEILDLFKVILEEEGYRVTLVASAIDDTQNILSTNPDLVILDLIFDREYMGWQTLQKMKMMRETERIPVVVCTADIRHAQDIQGYLLEKGVGLLLKPFNIDELLNIVKRQLTGRPMLPGK